MCTNKLMHAYSMSARLLEMLTWQEYDPPAVTNKKCSRLLEPTVKFAVANSVVFTEMLVTLSSPIAKQPNYVLQKCEVLGQLTDHEMKATKSWFLTSSHRVITEHGGVWRITYILVSLVTVNFVTVSIRAILFTPQPEVRLSDGVLSVKLNFLSIQFSFRYLTCVNHLCNVPITLFSVCLSELEPEVLLLRTVHVTLGLVPLGILVPSEPFGERFLQRSRFLWRFCVKSVSIREKWTACIVFRGNTKI